MQLSQDDDPYVQRVRPTGDEPLLLEYTSGEIMTIDAIDWEIDREHHRLYVNTEVLTKDYPPRTVHIPLGTLDGDNQANKVEETAKAKLPILRYSTVTEISDDPHLSHDFDAPVVEIWLGQHEKSEPIWTKGAVERLLP